MVNRPFPVRTLQVRERLVLDLLRGGAASNFATEDFARLRRHNERNGMQILAPDCPYIGPDEIRLIAWLALLQRQRSQPVIMMDAAWHDTLSLCAQHLERLNMRLDYRMIARSHTVPDPAILPSHTAPPQGDAALEKHVLDLEQRALAMLDEKGTVHRRALMRIGLTARMISLLCRRGLLQQVRHSVYTRPR